MQKCSSLHWLHADIDAFFVTCLMWSACLHLCSNVFSENYSLFSSREKISAMLSACNSSVNSICSLPPWKRREFDILNGLSLADFFSRKKNKAKKFVDIIGEKEVALKRHF